jgi:RNA recognition motif-containing protein
LFLKYGKLKRCDVKGNYAFITFEDERDAEDALEECQGKEVNGSRINIEWAKGSGRYDGARSKRGDDG